jgi:hypothetical protein
MAREAILRYLTISELFKSIQILLKMNNFAQFGSKHADKQEGGGQTGSSGGQTDYLDKGQSLDSFLDA